MFPVWPENFEAVAVFVALCRCWRIDRMAGIYEGLHRPSIHSTLKMMGIKSKRHKEILEKLALMESAALQILNRGK